MKTSVASVTFRRKSVCEVAELARRAGLDAVEWGGDIQVPPGNAQAARAALHCTRAVSYTHLWVFPAGYGFLLPHRPKHMLHAGRGED